MSTPMQRRSYGITMLLAVVAIAVIVAAAYLL
ncbi:hypothetical protein OPKNFCMD_6787 [Methylobacterium crusticola]|uniref:Uncharacterized protein n=1 Tax=Methylobacterium crusticola TaxID=1697972 RepID=A0ABQ4RBB2_9HYPH|nr:hypothetical protein OPKNFCMD_6787 [Methylobacterium crusticola]